MSFRRFDKPSRTFLETPILVPRRSLILMDGAARFGWEHAVRARSVDVVEGVVYVRGTRVSVTVRGVIEEGARRGCECAFEEVCDSRMVGGAAPERLKSLESFGEGGRKVDRHGRWLGP
jgi:alkylated DNA repair protein alkB homolog 8